MSLAYQEQTWAVRAACAGADPDSLFVRGAAQRQARNVLSARFAWSVWRMRWIRMLRLVCGVV